VIEIDEYAVQIWEMCFWITHIINQTIADLLVLKI
jgi:hypothetical protein